MRNLKNILLLMVFLLLLISSLHGLSREVSDSPDTLLSNNTIHEKLKSDDENPGDITRPSQPPESLENKEIEIDKKEVHQENSDSKKVPTEKSSGNDKKKFRDPPNRRWIINQGGMKKPEKNNKKTSAELEIIWADDMQKGKCKAVLETMKNDFRKAKYYSVQGDSCRTAAFAESFMGKAEQCEKDCPENFLERNGISEESIRNIKTLYRLGREKCLGR